MRFDYSVVTFIAGHAFDEQIVALRLMADK